MKIVCDIRRFNSPQTTKMGNPRLNINKDPIYTEYLKTTPNQAADIKQHMQRYISVISNFTDEEFSVLTESFDLSEKTQIDNEPHPYNYLERLQMVMDRINSLDDMTTGIVDMYNHVVARALRALDFPTHAIETARITIEDPLVRRMRNKLDSNIFELGDE